jgi:hypothetical protein
MRVARPVLLAALAACSSSTAPLPREGPPAALRVSYSGYGYGSHEVTLLRGDTLRVVRRTWERAAAVESTFVVPSADAWLAFWASARAAGVDGWPSRCADERIADGAGLGVRIAAGGRTVESTASNSWPLRDGRCSGPEQSAEVRTFLAAVGTLIGRRYPD